MNLGRKTRERQVARPVAPPSLSEGHRGRSLPAGQGTPSPLTESSSQGASAPSPKSGSGSVPPLAPGRALLDPRFSFGGSYANYLSDKRYAIGGHRG